MKHSSDVQEDSDAHYVILKGESSSPTFTAAKRVFSNKYTVTGMLPDWKYFTEW
jgi:hypothetical protein